MRPWLIVSLVTFALTVLAEGPSIAQEKKESPKPKKIKERDPAKIDDPDFKIQGEYEDSGTKKLGAQVVALGAGNFDVYLLEGGLPGAGWDGKKRTKISAKTVDGKVGFKNDSFGGIIENGTITMKGAGGEATLKKVERKSKTLGEKPPEGAIVLFGGPQDVDKWQPGKVAELSDGKFLDVEARSKQPFKSYKMHVEFRLPYQPSDRGQGRGNSGVYLQQFYEIQVLDSFGLKGENNECGSLYSIKAPDVNMCLPPLVWQTYDIDFTAAEFGADGKKTKNGRVTVYHNGVKVHDNVEIPHTTDGSAEKPNPGHILLQNHGDPLVYRNIWVVESK